MDDASNLASKLRQDIERLNAFLLALSEADRSAPVYADGALWTVRSVLAHLMSAENALVQLFRDVRRGGDGVDEGFSVDSFNAMEQIRNEQLTWEELLWSFQQTRTQLINFVEILTPEDLAKVGRHPFLGVTSLREMVKLIYVHSQMHLRDIRRTLGSG